MPLAVDRFGRPVYPVAPFGFGAATRAPYGESDDQASAGQRAAQPLQTWSGAPPQPMNAGDGDAPPMSWRPGGFTPAFPDVFGPWRKGAIESIGGLLHAVRPYSNMSGMGADTPECREEWAKAREWCAGQLDAAKKGVRPQRGVGYRNVEDCARSLVSAYCGGSNLADRPPEPPPEIKPPKKLEPDEVDDLDDTGKSRKKEEDCNDEWNNARRECAAEFASGKPNKAMTGGYLNIEDCARTRVSELCGGEPYKRAPVPRARRFNPRTGKWSRS